MVAAAASVAPLKVLPSTIHENQFSESPSSSLAEAAMLQTRSSLPSIGETGASARVGGVSAVQVTGAEVWLTEVIPSLAVTVTVMV